MALCPEDSDGDWHQRQVTASSSSKRISLVSFIGAINLLLSGYNNVYCLQISICPGRGTDKSTGIPCPTRRSTGPGSPRRTPCGPGSGTGSSTTPTRPLRNGEAFGVLVTHEEYACNDKMSRETWESTSRIHSSHSLG